MSDSISLNIAILPDVKTTETVIDISKKLKFKFHTKFVLNKKNCLPHITIYQVQIPTKNLKKVFGEVSKIANEINKFEIELNNLVIADQEIVWWNVTNPENLRKIQNNVIKNCNPLREGQILQWLKNPNISSIEKYEAKNYGSDRIDKRYVPHVTISFINPSQGNNVLKDIGKNKKHKMLATNIIVGALGQNGRVSGVIRKFKLS